MKEKPNVLVVAGTTTDIIGGHERTGGSAYYITQALYLLGIKPTVITNSPKLTASLGNKARILAPSKGSDIVYKINYLDSGERELTLLKSSVIPVLDLISSHALENPDLVIVSPVDNEIRLEDLTTLLNFDAPTVIDLQGFVRKINRDGKIVNNPGLFRELAYLLVNENVIVRGERSEFPPECRGKQIIQCSGKYGITLVQTSGTGPIYFSTAEGTGCVMNPLVRAKGDDVGSGDIFTAILAYMVLISDLKEAVATASVASTLKILRGKLPWFTFNEIMSLKDEVMKTLRCGDELE